MSDPGWQRHPADDRPVCECGTPGCFPTELPMEAWKYAGEGGAGEAPDGSDIIAILTEHLLSDHVVVYEGNGWLGVYTTEGKEVG